MSAPDYEMLHDEYNDLQLHCWNKFYSYVVQYHQVSFSFFLSLSTFEVLANYSKIKKK